MKLVPRPALLFPALLGLLLLAAPAFGGIVVLPAADRGQYDDTGFHDPANGNYRTGMRGIGVAYRSWFVFDLSGVTDPIVGAVLYAWNPVTGFASVDPTEDLSLYDVGTAVAALAAGGSGLVGIYADLGSGTVYGSVTVSPADNGTAVGIPVNAAGLAALNGATGLFAFGGSLTSISGLVEQRIFGFTGASDSVTLVLTTVPEPSAFALFGLGVLGLAAARRGTRASR